TIAKNKARRKSLIPDLFLNSSSFIALLENRKTHFTIAKNKARRKSLIPDLFLNSSSFIALLENRKT
ncbi:hypothetical protein V5H32_23510, partial [Salmonella enterica]